MKGLDAVEGIIRNLLLVSNVLFSCIAEVRCFLLPFLVVVLLNLALPRKSFY